MFTISNHIYNEINNSTVSIKELTEDERIEILNNVVSRYIYKEKKGIWFWEKLCDYDYITDSLGWNYIKDFIGNNQCIMFFNQEEEKNVFNIFW